MISVDAVIVGAGPAGLTAATYLGRFHCKVVVIDGGASRARWIPESHNIPGFPRGISGSTLLAELREQRGLNQVVVAAAEAAVAATQMHNQLREVEFPSEK